MKTTSPPISPALMSRFKFLVWMGLLISLVDLACMLALGDRFPPHVAGIVLMPALVFMLGAFHVLYKALPPKERRWRIEDGN
ncbi:hypothetical protein Enr10x_19720 [Gimesia panareensis]|uniref:Uncharacterized protein n=1 Tax=Gimesia panareensis TaxID=2527978 RepID=A0A517Q4Z4_9PLAN|nr:hypothetical protein [Gimesia panareensis]QDT26662.1 hypothetical protein Enr10x_19720 [Gimesia panareensis]